MNLAPKRLLMGLVAGAACLSLLSVANANTAYTNVAGGGYSFSNIQDVVTVNGTTTDSQYYGQPTVDTTPDGIYLIFSDPNISSTAGNGASSATISRVYFDVSVNPIQASPATSVYSSEYGGFSQLGAGTGSGGSGSVSGTLFVTPYSDPAIVYSGPLTTVPPGPFTTNISWTGSATATVLSGGSNFHVALNNNLLTTANNPGVVALDKKFLEFFFPTTYNTGNPPGTPEPATLGLLAIGATALLNRRHRKS